jgi:hypothetical protein
MVQEAERFIAIATRGTLHDLARSTERGANDIAEIRAQLALLKPLQRAVSPAELPERSRHTFELVRRMEVLLHVMEARERENVNDAKEIIAFIDSHKLTETP